MPPCLCGSNRTQGGSGFSFPFHSKARMSLVRPHQCHADALGQFAIDEVVRKPSQPNTERGYGRSQSASQPPCRRRREETHYLSLSLRRPTDGKSQSLVTSSPTDANGTSVAPRARKHAACVDLLGRCGLPIRAPESQRGVEPPHCKAFYRPRPNGGQLRRAPVCPGRLTTMPPLPVLRAARSGAHPECRRLHPPCEK